MTTPEIGCFETHGLELLATHGLSRTYLDKRPLHMDRFVPQGVQGEL